MELTAFLVHALLLVLAIHSGESVKCYVCNSRTDPRCEDPSSPANTAAQGTSAALEPKECNSQILNQASEWLNTATRKASDWANQLGFDTKSEKFDTSLVCNKLEVEFGDKKVVYRGCSPPISEKLDYCKKLTDQFNNQNGKVGICSVCDTDACNSAPGLQSAATVLMTAVAFLLAARQ